MNLLNNCSSMGESINQVKVCKLVLYSFFYLFFLKRQDFSYIHGVVIDGITLCHLMCKSLVVYQF